MHTFATVDGRPAGVVSVARSGHPSRMELILMWVAPYARAQRVGDVLVRYAIDWVAENATALRLDIREHNTAAMLYERHGLRTVGRTPQNRCEVTVRRPVPQG